MRRRGEPAFHLAEYGRTEHGIRGQKSEVRRDSPRTQPLISDTQQPTRGTDTDQLLLQYGRPLTVISTWVRWWKACASLRVTHCERTRIDRPVRSRGYSNSEWTMASAGRSTWTVKCERLTPIPDSVRMLTVTAFLMKSRL